MKSIKIAAGALVAATLLAGAPAASAAGPVDVLVRIEGVDSTIQPRVSLRTSTGTVTKDGQHSCTGTSAAGALEIATRGDWTGPWSDAYGYGIDVVRGNAHPFFSGNYWAFYVNDVAQSTGICGRELSAGEEVLFVPQPEDPAKTKGLLRLSGVPARIAPGEAVTVTVTRHTSEFAADPPYTPSGKSAPAANATVTGNGVTLTTDAQGRASFVPAARGELDLRATRDGDVRSATERLCVTDGADGACGHHGARALRDQRLRRALRLAGPPRRLRRREVGLASSSASRAARARGSSPVRWRPIPPAWSPCACASSATTAAAAPASTRTASSCAARRPAASRPASGSRSARPPTGATCCPSGSRAGATSWTSRSATRPATSTARWQRGRNRVVFHVA